MATAKKTAAKKVSANKGKRISGSMSDQIDNLAVGQCVAVAERHDIDGQNGSTVVTESLKKLRSGMSAYVTRITDDLDTREFKTESGTYLTDDKTGIIASVTVTRMA